MSETTNIERIRPVKGNDEYTISTLGILRDLDGNIVFLPNHQGYSVKSMIINGERQNVRIHRLVLETFSPEREENQTAVNHKNSLRHDNRLENLEWVTPKENINHGQQTKGSITSFPIDMWNVETKEQLSFNSVRDAAKFAELPFSWETLYRWATFSNDVIHTGGWRIKRKDEEWLEIDDEDVDPNLYRVRNRVNIVVRDLVNDIDLIFNSQKDASETTGVSEAAISVEVNRNKQRVINDRWAFKYVNEPWREFKSIIEEIRDNDPNRTPIIAYHRDGSEEVFPSVKLAAREIGVGDSTIHYNLSVNVDRDKDKLKYNSFGYAFKYV